MLSFPVSQAMKDVSDENLLERYCSGDKAALTELVTRYQIDLQRFIYRIVGNADDSADLLQKVFINLFLKAEQFRGQSSFKTWLYQIAMNQCKNFFRGKERMRLDPSAPDWDNMVCEDADVYLDVENEQERTQLNQALTRLPERQRATMQLRLQMDYTFKEIALLMNVSEGTVKAQYHQALMSLKRILLD